MGIWDLRSDRQSSIGQGTQIIQKLIDNVNEKSNKPFFFTPVQNQ